LAAGARGDHTLRASTVAECGEHDDRSRLHIVNTSLDLERARSALHASRLMLVFTPELCLPRDAREVLESVLDFVDIVQVRPKPIAAEAVESSPSSARAAYEWTVVALDVLRARPSCAVPVIVNDRVDVAAALRERGCAGVHLGQDDCPVDIARRVLGSAALIGVSTHDMTQVTSGEETSADYLGFGPIHSTRTKGYPSGQGAEACWIASVGSRIPVFPIGGIDVTNVGELARVGRAAVGAAILLAPDPARTARVLRGLLANGERLDRDT
jgi:thiamine-phosphate pyrophosphorylase